MNTTATQPQTPTTSKATLRRSGERGHLDHGWLNAKHSFSFGDYYDPAHMSYASLRVINEDHIAPGKGFGMHSHSAMEIFTYIISGELEHQDSMGNGRVIKAGEFQYMSAGSGVMHAEKNPSSDEEVHLLQIWITPDQTGGDPLYADMDTHAVKRKNDLTLFASGDGRNGSQKIRQHAEIFFGHLGKHASLSALPDGKFDQHYLQLIKGKLLLAGNLLMPGDAVMIDGTAPAIQAKRDTEFLYFNL